MNNNSFISGVEPRKFYPLKDIVKELGYTSRNKIAQLSEELKARGQGDSKLVLGENILVYFGSPTIGQPLKTSGNVQIPDKDSQLELDQAEV